jgi:gliding motility-associated-like protein
MNFKKNIAFIVAIIFCALSISLFANGNVLDTTKQPDAIVLSVTTVNSTCQKFNGKIIVQATGGVAPYNFELLGFYGYGTTNNGIFYKMRADTYTLTVTDAMGTQVIQTVVLGNTFPEPHIPSFNYASPPSSCTNHDGTLTVNTSGGTPPYMYSIDNINFQPNNIFPNLTNGNYFAIVKDANGCTTLGEGVQSPTNFQIATNVPSDCSINTTGYIGIESSNQIYCNPFRQSVKFRRPTYGLPPFTYSMDGINYQIDSLFPPLSEGLYTFYIKDALGVILLHTESLLDFYCNQSFLLSTSITTAICGINGAISINATEGTPPYEYSLDGVNFQTSNQYSGLPSGNYFITVKDFYGLLSTKYAIVPNNCLQVIPTTQSSTCGNNNGSITAQASNGTAPYEYSINGGAYGSNNVFNNLAANNYTIRAKDATNRVATANTIVSNIAGAQILAADTTATGCINNTGKINVVTQGGTAPYMYSIDGTNFQTGTLFTGLAQNNYTITVKDARGCLTTKLALIRFINNLAIDAGDTLKICEGKNGTTNATGNAATYTWLPMGGLATPSLLNTSANPLQTTTYYLTGTTGICTKSDSMLVLVKPAPIAEAGQGQTICFGKNASLQAGAGQLSYTWQPSTFLSNANAAFADVIKPTNNITYSLSVVGTNGCASLQDGHANITVTPPPKVFVGNDTSIAIGEPFILQALEVNGSGFNKFEWQPFYLLNDAAAQYPLIQNIKENTTFSLIATTAAGCVGKDSIRIKVFNKPDIYVPNAFTPNGDGKNDMLRAIPVGIKLFNSFTVYDRYGHTIFTTTNASNGWDGKNNGGILNTGGFVWVASGVDFNGRDIFRKGSVLIIK